MDYFLEQDRRELHPDADDLARIAELREAAVAAPAPPVRGRPFAKGRSGNPAGKRRGTRNKATLLAETILYEQAGPVMSSTVETAKSGNVLAQKVCVERLLAPRRERFLAFEMPPIETAADLAPAMGAVMAALAAGEITPGEAERITNTALGWMRAIEIGDLAVQLQELRLEMK
jgi:hypothetical protein